MNVSIIVVTYNDVRLYNTLTFISKLDNIYEIVIVDGMSDSIDLPLIEKTLRNVKHTLIREPDCGIYYAMNKALDQCSGDFLHFINCGDYPFGAIYQDLSEVRLIPVLTSAGLAKKFLMQSGYCHQGVIFRNNSLRFDVRYKISADYKFMLQHFPSGIKAKIEFDYGYIYYDLNGFSNRNMLRRDIEYLLILCEFRKYILVIYMCLKICLKLFLFKYYNHYLSSKDKD
jgi:glycosyltransferase involved in cell wall biosynthesis